MFRESINILIVEGILFLFAIIGWGLWQHIVLLVVITVFAVSIVFTLHFFRDPHREIPEKENVFLSPTDGLVVCIEDIPHFPLSDGAFKMVTIYLSLWNVHINRVPISGRVTYLDYKPGCFFPAFGHRSSERNEHTMIGIAGTLGHVFVKQIAGMVARRIVCRLQMGDQVVRGQRFGIIKFGSRIELYLPQSVSIMVSEGDRVRGGESIIAEKS